MSFFFVVPNEYIAVPSVFNLPTFSVIFRSPFVFVITVDAKSVLYAYILTLISSTSRMFNESALMLSIKPSYAPKSKFTSF